MENNYVNLTALSSKAAGCFAAGTLVHTKEGMKPIEDIRVGDWVLSYPEDKETPAAYRENRTELYQYRQVTKISVHEDLPVVHLTFWDLGNNIQETVRVTTNHPIYVKGRRWASAGTMIRNDVVFNVDFCNALVRKIQSPQEKTRVFNIEVDDFHTYFVGELGIWVHSE
jgi:hypothetical protein